MLIGNGLGFVYDRVVWTDVIGVQENVKGEVKRPIAGGQIGKFPLVNVMVKLQSVMVTPLQTGYSLVAPWQP